MKKFFPILLLCLTHIATAQNNTIIATADDIKITQQQLQTYLQTLPPEIQQANDPQTKQKIIDVLIQRTLLEKQAIKNGIDKTPEVQARLNQAKQTILADVYIEQLVKKQITEAEVQAEYEKYLSQTPERQEVRARHILLATEAEAKDIIKKLQQGENFIELAKAHSTGPSAPNGGDLGYFVHQQMLPEFADASFAMKVGDFSPQPVQTQFGWHVILLEDKRTTAALALKDVRPQIEQKIGLTKIENVLKDLTKNVEVKYINP